MGLERTGHAVLTPVKGSTGLAKLAQAPKSRLEKMGIGATSVVTLLHLAAAKAAGLSFVKVARFSETHTAEKLEVPAAER